MDKRPLCVVTAVFICGILSAMSGVDFIVLILLLLLLLIYFAIKKKRQKLLLLLPMIFYIGMNRMNFIRQQLIPGDLQSGQKVQLSGEVYRTEIKNEKCIVYLKNLIILEIQSEKVKSNFQNSLSNNCCIVYLQQEQNLKIGNIVTVSGISQLFSRATNEGQFDALLYYKGQKISFSVQKAVLVSRNKQYNVILQTLSEFRIILHEQFDKILDKQKASILQAMLLGDKVDAEIKKLYQDNSISHILVISGMHFSVIGMFIYEILRRLGASFKLAGVICIVFLFFYGVMTGFGVSAMRAFVMFCIGVGARVLGRTYDIATSLALSVLLLLWDNPYNLLQCGFLLSVGAILGIILLLPIFEELFGGRNKYLTGLYSSLAIQILTLPVLLYFFSQTAVYAVILNFIILPLVSVVMLTAFVALGISFMSIKLAKIIIIPASVIFDFYEGSCRTVQKLPSAMFVSGRPRVIPILLYSVGLILWVIAFYYFSEKKKNNDQENNDQPQKCKLWLQKGSYIGWIIVLLCILLWKRDDKLSITMLDVGQGESIYIRTKKGTDILYDGGSTDVSKVGTYRIVPYLKSQGTDFLDFVFISHLDNDHISGIQEMIEEKSMKIGCLFLPDTCMQDESFLKMQKIAKDNKIPVKFFGKGSLFREEDLTLTGLHPSADYQTDSRNDTSIVMLLKYKNFTMLFAGDMEEGAEKKLLEEKVLEDVDVLQVAHHGSQYSSSEEILDEIKPEYAWISCGVQNSYGHPHQALLERLIKKKCKIFITTKTGQITIKTDGKCMKMIPYFKETEYN